MLDQILEYKNKVQKTIDNNLKQNNIDSKNINYVLITIIFFIVYYVLFDKALDFITRLISLIYPSYKSYQSIEKDSSNNNWMSYWIVYSTITTFEIIGWMIINYIPFYQIIKLSFIIWLVFPDANNSSIFYQKFIEPFFNQNSDKINQQLDKVDIKISSIKKNIANWLSE